jgi:hypothetical protein
LTALLALVLALTAHACVYKTLTPAGEIVRVTPNPNVVQDCEYLGEVEGGDGWNGGIAGQRAAEENAQRDLRNKAAAMGADVVLLATAETGTSGATIRGEAYACTSG